MRNLLKLMPLILLVPTTVFAADFSLDKYRILLDEKNRRDQVSLLNESFEMKDFRLKLVDFAMNNEGKLIPAKAFALSAKPYLRIGPKLAKQVPSYTPQKFKIKVKGKKLKSGEYRTHLVIENTKKKIRTVEELLKNPNIRLSIPIFIRHGELDAQLKITNSEKVKDQDGNEFLAIRFLRQGNRSIYGHLEIKDKVNGTPVFSQEGLAIYTEVSDVQFKFPLDKFTKHSGNLEAHFSEYPEYGGDINLTANLKL